MKLTQKGTDYIEINEESLDDDIILKIPKIHLIKLNFREPTKEKIEDAIQLFYNTNRFVIANNTKIYNDTFKNTIKKYYVENQPDQKLVSFFRKNNKVLLNFSNVNEIEFKFLIYSLLDVLKNVEVVQMPKKVYLQNIQYFENWNGNVIIN